jgi:hypothetical protein
VVDDCGNDAEQLLRITRHFDETDPVIECPDDIVIGVCDEFPAIVTPQATDNCGGAVEVVGTRSDNLALDAPFPVGQTITVTFTATDDCGNDASCDFTVTVNPCEGPHCTYTQGYYGDYNGSACTPDGQPTYDHEIMVNAINEAGGFFNFGNVGSGNYFTLKASDIYGDPNIKKNNIFVMLPGGGRPRALRGFATYDQPSTWADSDPLDGSNRPRRGSINNNLLSQTMTLFFNKSVDPGLGAFELDATFATADVACGSDIPDMGSVQVFSIPQSVITYLTNNGGATVDNLFILANKALGGLPGLPSHEAINSAVDAINNGFDQCRVSVAVPVDDVVSDPTPLEGIASESLFSAYPNPFKEYINIRYEFDYQSKARVEIFDAKGMFVMAYDDADAYFNKEVQLNTTFNHGEGQMFFVKVITDRAVSTKKVVSKK